VFESPWSRRDTTPMWQSRRLEEFIPYAC